MDIFENDEAIAEFKGLREGIHHGDHKASFIIDLDVAAYFSETIPPSSRKNEKNKIKNEWSLGENHKAPSNQEKVKRNLDLSKGENLSKAPEDGGLNCLPINQEISLMLIKDIIEVNISIVDNPKTVLFAAYLT